MRCICAHRTGSGAIWEAQALSPLVIGGNVVAALLHPLVLGGLALSLISGYPPWHNDDRFVVALYVINLLVGYLGSGVLG